jgi:hypothetical protein
VFVAAGASDYYTVTGNNFHGAGTGVNDNGTGTHKSIANNVGP